MLLSGCLRTQFANDLCAIIDTFRIFIFAGGSIGARERVRRVTSGSLALRRVIGFNTLRFSELGYLGCQVQTWGKVMQSRHSVIRSMGGIVLAIATLGI